MNLSLSPRFDMFRFMIPKEYIPKAVLNKYDAILAKDPSVFLSAIDYLNESIQGISLPAIENLIVEQPQTARNSINPSGIGMKSNMEPDHIHSVLSSENILTKIGNTFTVTFRQNEGLYNYFMMYESIFHRYVKPELYRADKNELFEIVILDREGIPTSKIKLLQPEFNGISSLEFSYNKVERQDDTFDVTFAFNNIDFDFIPNT